MISVSLLWIWRLLLASFKLALRSLGSLTKSSQVSRAKGTNHTHQSAAQKEELLSRALRVVLVCDISVTSVEMEAAVGFFHSCFEVIGQPDKVFTSL